MGVQYSTYVVAEVEKTGKLPKCSWKQTIITEFSEKSTKTTGSCLTHMIVDYALVSNLYKRPRPKI